MPGIAGGTAKELEFMYESDAVSSFSRDQVCRKLIIEYQGRHGFDNNEIDQCHSCGDSQKKKMQLPSTIT